MQLGEKGEFGVDISRLNALKGAQNHFEDTLCMLSDLWRK
jgi:hypothetical protein